MSIRSSLTTIKEVFSNRNILAIGLTTSLWTLCNSGWRPFWSMYLTEELGAGVAAVGILSTIQTADQLLFQLPGGIMADKYGRRKIIVYGTSLRLLPPIIYWFSTHWTHTILAVIINGAASVYNPAFNAIIADSMPEDKRGAGYGAYRTITSMPRIFSPLIGGIVMDMMGYKEGVRVFLVLSMITAIIITSVRAWTIKETLDLGDVSKPKKEKTPFKDSVKETLTLPKQIWYMVIVAVLGSFGSRLVMSYIPIYAMGEEGLALSSSQYGLITTIGAIFNTVLAIPGGLMADKFGRKPMILISRITGPLSLGLTPFTYNFQSFFGVRILNNIGAALGGGGRGRAGGPSWNAMLADMVPPEKRGTVMGTIGSLTGILGVPAPIIGSYLWEVFSPMIAFQTSAIFGFLGATIFFLFVKEHYGKHLSFDVLPANSGD